MTFCTSALEIFETGLFLSKVNLNLFRISPLPLIFDVKYLRIIVHLYPGLCDVPLPPGVEDVRVAPGQRFGRFLLMKMRAGVEL